LSTGIRSVDHISEPVMFLPILRETAVIRSSLATTALPFASCPVTIRLTISVMTFLHSGVCSSRTASVAPGRDGDAKRQKFQSVLDIEPLGLRGFGVTVSGGGRG
jgi:hypothetical protein